MKRYKILTLISALAAGLFVGGCNDADVEIPQPKDGTPGAPVQFTLSSSMTKTVYSGDGEYSGSQLVRERIDWVAGDVIRIYCADTYVEGNPDKHWGDYRVAEVNTESSSVSQAVLEPCSDDDRLAWGTANSYEFFAAYPSPAVSSGVVFDPENGEFSGKISGTQVLRARSATSNDYQPDMSQSYLFAHNVVPWSNRLAVSLDFESIVNEFQFHIGKGSNPDAYITSVEVTSLGAENLYGTFSVPFATCDDPATFNCTAAGGKKIDVSFASSSGGALDKVSADNLSFTVLALPQDLTGGVQIKIRRNIGIDYTMTLKSGGNVIAFNACAKARINGLEVPESTRATLVNGTSFNKAVKSLPLNVPVSGVANTQGYDDVIKKITFKAQLSTEVLSKVQLQYGDSNTRDITSTGEKVYAFYDSQNAEILVATTADELIANASCRYMFRGLRALEYLSTENLNTSNTYNFGWMFYYCGCNHEKLDLDLSTMDTHSATHMDNMFAYGKYKTIDMRSASSASITKLGSGVDAANKDTGVYCMFYKCSFLEKLILGPQFDFSKTVSSDKFYAGFWPNTVLKPGITSVYASEGFFTTVIQYIKNYFTGDPENMPTFRYAVRNDNVRCYSITDMKTAIQWYNSSGTAIKPSAVTSLSYAKDPAL